MPLSLAARTVTQIAINAPAGTTDLVAAPGTALKIYVTSIVFSVDTALTTVKFTEGTGPTDLTGVMTFAQGGGMAPATMPGADGVILQTNTANSKLSIVTATGAARGWLRYFIAP